MHAQHRFNLHSGILSTRRVFHKPQQFHDRSSARVGRRMEGRHKADLKISVHGEVSWVDVGITCPACLAMVNRFAHLHQGVAARRYYLSKLYHAGIMYRANVIRLQTASAIRPKPLGRHRKERYV